MRLSLTARLALLFALMAASLLAVVGVVLGRAVVAHFDELDHHELASKLAVIRNLIADTTTVPAVDALPHRLDDALSGHDNVGALLRDAEGRVIYTALPASFPPAQRAGTPLGGASVTWTLDGRHYIGRELQLEMPLAEPRPVRALVALDITHHMDFLTGVRNGLWVGISAAALVAALLGWLAARKGLAPLRRITATAAQLSAERLGERLSERDAPAEVLELVEAFNGMLDRLESSFRRLSDFSADIAHELRTPVSNLMTETQVALSRPRSAEEYRDILHSNLEEFDRLARMIADMLFLAKADNGLLPRPAETVALEDEARALADFYEALAEEKEVRLVVIGAAAVKGDRLMLRRAISNLVSNALRHTPRGETVAIEIGSENGEATLTVRNPGEPIRPEHMARLFERFHRIDPSRARHSDGAGLGLAITRSIAEAHGGRVGAESRGGVTSFWLRLPRVKASAPAPRQDTRAPDAPHPQGQP